MSVRIDKKKMNIAKNPINYYWPDEVIIRDLLLCSKLSCGGAIGTQLTAKEP